MTVKWLLMAWATRPRTRPMASRVCARCRSGSPLPAGPVVALSVVIDSSDVAMGQGGRCPEIPNTKRQAPNKPQAPNPKPEHRPAFWNLVLGACLEFGAWNLELMGKAGQGGMTRKSKRPCSDPGSADESRLGQPSNQPIA